MSYYYIHTFDGAVGAQFKFDSQTSDRLYECDDRTGFVIDNVGQSVKLSYLQSKTDKYSVISEVGYDKQVTSDGSASSYYDFPRGALTLNDLLEFKGDNQWLGDSFHLSNIVKAAWRWGDKAGVDKPYDARKIIYSGCRLLMKLAGVQEVRKTLQGLLDDPQFQERK